MIENATRTGWDTLEAHLRVEVVDDRHRDWPAVRRQMVDNGRLVRLATVTGEQLSARQAVVAAFLDGRAVGHAAFHVEPVRFGVAARMDSLAVEAPFGGTAVERTLLALAECRLRTMGCLGFAAPSGCGRRAA